MAERLTQEELIEASGLLKPDEQSFQVEYLKSIISHIRQTSGDRALEVVSGEELKVILYEYLDHNDGLALQAIARGVRNKANLAAAIDKVASIQEEHPEAKLREIMAEYREYLKKRNAVTKKWSSSTGYRYKGSAFSKKRQKGYENAGEGFSDEVLAIGGKINLVISAIKTKRPPKGRHRR